MEDAIYVCGWKKSKDGYSLWTNSKPKIQVQGATYELAEELLLEEIANRLSVFHAVLEFDPPLSPNPLDSKYVDPELFLISGDDDFKCDVPRETSFETKTKKENRFRAIDEYFTAPVCRRCMITTGVRNHLPISFVYGPSTDGGFGFIGHERTFIHVFSEKFVSALTHDERSRIEFVPTTKKPRCRQFYELRGPAGASFVAAARLERSGWVCEECGRKSWGYFIPNMHIRSFIAASDLPNPLPSMFVVGSPPDVHLCVRGDRWRKLIGKPGMRGIISRPLGVLQDKDVVRNPKLPTIGEGREKNRKPTKKK